MNTRTLILIAEDDENDVFFMTRALRDAAVDAATHFVPDGQVAIEYFAGIGQYADRRRFPLPDMAILDIKMPRRTGLEVLQWLREQKQFKDLPVMILSSSSLEKDIETARQWRATNYLIKHSNLKATGREVKRFYLFHTPNLHRSPDNPSGQEHTN